MATHMRTEIVEGCEGTGIKCGVIGEIGCNWPLEGIFKDVLGLVGLYTTSYNI